MGLGRRILYPLKKTARISKHHYISFDVETTGTDNNFLLMHLHSPVIDLTFTTQKDARDWFLNAPKRICKKYTIVATNLFFDFSAVFFGHTVYDTSKKIFRGTQLIYVKLPNGLRFVDSMNYYTGSVKDMGEILKIPKLPLPSYIKEGRVPDIEELDYIKRYCANDALITYEFMRFFEDTVNLIGGKLKLTIASTSVDLFRRQYMDLPMQQPAADIIEEMRSGYYGGRTETFKRGLFHDVHKYDYNSAYPATFRYLFPDSNTLGLMTNPPTEYIHRYDGMTYCEITCKKIDIPLLPYRDTKLLFPYGTWRAMYTNIELRKAISIGYKVMPLRMYYYTRSYRPFARFGTDLYKKRMSYKAEKSKMEYPVKILLNSFYGKLGQRSAHDIIKHETQLTDADILNPSILVTNTEGFYRLRENNKRSPAYINPIYPAYVTAYARIKLYEDFERIGFKNIIYCDTDSIFTKSLIKTSDRLGELKHEGTIKNLLMIRPKMYMQDDEIKVKGLQKDKAADPQAVMLDILAHKAMHKNRFVKYFEMIRSMPSHKTGKLIPNQIIEVNKIFSLEDDKREWKDRKFNPEIIENSSPVKINHA